ncbi:MAG: circularly permuted type 2 ATP-grasp protein [Neomegalonema sp.]|nr:circularly permuted type 2 ATP-grasp protein [Neomegalonema sp.]
MTAKLDRDASRAHSAGHNGYVSRSGVFDEMVGADGELRGSWRAVSQWFDRHQPEELAHHAARAEQILSDQFSEPRAGAIPWRLDIAPLAISLDEWRKIEAAATQRARLYAALLADLYGEQRLFAGGVLPPEVILRDPRYVRPLFGAAPEAVGLTMLALDFARSPSGEWRVLDAHAETTAGHGYVIANRMVMAEIAGDLFRSSQALRIGSFFQRMGDVLATRAKTDDPRIALLAGGSSTPGFIGHAYLARYLGYQRVEGADLRVLDDRVYFKTVHGLQRVDLILRGVEGVRSDPLELAPDGFDGPAGLVRAVKANAGLVANGLGASVIENRGLSPFLRAIAGCLLGEELVAPDSPRLWLGQRAIREAVLADLDSYVVYDAFEGAGRPGQAREGRRASVLDGEERAELVQRLEMDGAAYVAEQPQGLATAPSWTGRELRPAPYALRAYVLLDGDTPVVMPGGVGLNIDVDAAVGLSARNAYSRDVWVIGDAPPNPAVSLSRIAATTRTSFRAQREVQSRVADDLFWVGRYCGRADAILRILRESLTDTGSDLGDSRDSGRPSRALAYLVSKDEPDANVADWPLAAAVCAVCGRDGRGYGLASTFASLRSAAARNRDRLSSESWSILSSLTVDGLSCPGCPSGEGACAYPVASLEVIEACEARLRDLTAFSGLTYENLTRDLGWRFLDLGRRIERAHNQCELLLALFEKVEAPETERGDLAFVLSVVDSALTYRAHYRFGPEISRVLDLVMIEESNPRSLAYQLALCLEHIQAFPKSDEDAARAPDQRLALDLLTKVRLADIDALCTVDENGARAALGAFLRELINGLPKLSEMVSRQYFSLADEAPRRLRPRTTL